MYIGDTKKTLEEMWVCDNNSDVTSEAKMTKRMVEHSPGFLKVFDENISFQPPKLEGDRIVQFQRLILLMNVDQYKFYLLVMLFYIFLSYINKYIKR